MISAQQAATRTFTKTSEIIDYQINTWRVWSKHPSTPRETNIGAAVENPSHWIKTAIQTLHPFIHSLHLQAGDLTSHVPRKVPKSNTETQDDLLHCGHTSFCCLVPSIKYTGWGWALLSGLGSCPVSEGNCAPKYWRRGSATLHTDGCWWGRCRVCFNTPGGPGGRCLPTLGHHNCSSDGF